MPTVRMPDGSTAQFPDGMAPKDIESAITAHLASSSPQPAGLPPGQSLPGFPAAPVPAGLQPGSQPQSTPLTRLLGSGNPMDAFGVVGTHLKNMAAVPYHAFTDAPQSAQEAAQKGTDPTSGLTANALGQFGLGMARMFVNPTLNSGKAAIASAKAGNYTDAANQAMDAVPIAGPWARSIENDAQAHGAIPALMGAATDIAGPSALAKGAGMVLKPLAQSAAIGDVTRMIKPSMKDVSFAKSPAEGLLNQPGGIFDWSKEGLLDRSKQNLQKLGTQIGDQVAQAPQTATSNVSGAVLKPFDSALSDAAVSNDIPLFNRLQQAKEGLTTDKFYDPSSESIQQAVGPKNLTALTPNDLFAMKKGIGNNIKWTNQAFDDDLNATRGQVYGGLKDALNTAVPELKPLNEGYANLKAGVDSLSRRLPIEQRNNAISLPDATLGAGTVVSKGVPAAALAMGMKKILFSTPLRTGLDAGLWRYGNAPSATLIPSATGLILRGALHGNDQR